MLTFEIYQDINFALRITLKMQQIDERLREALDDAAECRGSDDTKVKLGSLPSDRGSRSMIRDARPKDQ